MALPAGAAAVSAALTGKTLFDYNRENFMEDREQRMKKEFAERKYRIVQSNLWRQDVRDFISLTERKMSIYLLVNVLFLGFNLNLWCEGRLPEGTPDWLMMGNQIAIGGSFMFLLLTVWLAMHASVAAQSYQTRILTQLVRLPVPTWDELEACRTAGSEFEKMEPMQLFRVPFVCGYQESRARATAAAAASAGGSRPALGTPSTATSDVVAPAVAGGVLGMGPALAPSELVSADPWGLERRGDDILELGCQHGEEVAKLRHIKLVRQAAVYWQTYDAFARVSMSVGVNQLMLAMSYYILGYCMTQVKAPMAALAGVIVFMGAAEVVARIDLTLAPNHQRLVHALLALGPVMSYLSAYNWVQERDLEQQIAECLAPVAFISHGVVVGLMTLFIRVREQENGAMLPLAFQGVLFLDVFGWVSHKKARSAGDRMAGRALSALTPKGAAEPAALRSAARRVSSYFAGAPGAIQQELPADAMGYYAMDYVMPPQSVEKLKAVLEEGEEEESDDEGADYMVTSQPRAWRPAASAITYNEAGRPCPLAPSDLAKTGTVDDMRYVPGAPLLWDEVNAIEPPAKEFWNPVTFMPPENRRRRAVDDFVRQFSKEEPSEESKLAQVLGRPQVPWQREDTPILTGHDNEVPGMVPFKIFRNFATLMSIVWITAGAYYIFVVTGVWSLALPFWHDLEQEHNPVVVQNHTRHFLEVLQTNSKVVPEPSMLSLLAAGVSGGHMGHGSAERIIAVWPYPSMAPHTLSCDASGEQLLVTDGLSTFAAKLEGAGGIGVGAPRLRGDASSPSSGEGALRARFSQAPPCGPLRGEALQDAALICPGMNSTAPCEALVLHHDGQRIAACPTAAWAEQEVQAPLAFRSFAAGISPGWLRKVGNGESSALAAAGPEPHKPEHVDTLLVDLGCASSGATSALKEGCAAVATSHGRLVQLQKKAHAEELVPFNILEPTAAEAGPKRAFNGRYFGMLQPRRRSIAVFDAEDGGRPSGTLLLPVHLGRVNAFCIGGGHVYLVESGASPALWRYPLPTERLRPDI